MISGDSEEPRTQSKPSTFVIKDGRTRWRELMLRPCLSIVQFRTMMYTHNPNIQQKDCNPIHYETNLFEAGDSLSLIEDIRSVQNVYFK